MAVAKYSKEEFYNEILRLYKDHSRIDINIFKNYSNIKVNFNYYCNKFGGLKNICKELKIDYLYYNQIPRKEIINDVIRVYKENGNKISKELYEKDGKYAVIVIRREFGGFNKLLELLGYKINMNKNTTKEEVIRDVLDFWIKYKSTSSTLYRKYGKYSQTIIDRLFDSWVSLLKELDLKPMSEKIGFDTMREQVIELYEKHGFISAELVNNNCEFTYQALIHHCGGSKGVSEILGVDNAFLGRNSTNAETIYNIIVTLYGEDNVCTEKTWDWLKNDKTNTSMYIDIYIKPLNLAIEYDGQQHFRFVEYFHKTYDKFSDQVYRDKLKNKLMHEYNVNLIRIKFDEDISYENIMSKIEKCLN